MSEKEVCARVFFDLTIADKDAGRVEMDLYCNTPRTTENFRSLCTGERGTGTSGKALHFKGSSFHRVIPGFMAQGGDFTHGNGMGGESIYSHKFADENFDNKHTGPGILSMANAGRNTNGSQFFLCFDKTPHLDNKHVVFGSVMKGFAVLGAVESFGSRNGKTSKPIKIKDCGQLWKKEGFGDKI